MRKLNKDENEQRAQQITRKTSDIMNRGGEQNQRLSEQIRKPN